MRVTQTQVDIPMALRAHILQTKRARLPQAVHTVQRGIAPIEARRRVISLVDFELLGSAGPLDELAKLGARPAKAEFLEESAVHFLGNVGRLGHAIKGRIAPQHAQSAEHEQRQGAGLAPYRICSAVGVHRELGKQRRCAVRPVRAPLLTLDNNIIEDWPRHAKAPTKQLACRAKGEKDARKQTRSM